MKTIFTKKLKICSKNEKQMSRKNTEENYNNHNNRRCYTKEQRKEVPRKKRGGQNIIRSN